MKHLLILLSFLLLTSPTAVYSAQNRVALVIGNGAYRNAPLRNPVNDARLMRMNGESPDLRDVKISTLSNFNKGFELYQNQQFENALELFRTCLERVPEDHVSELYVERCQKIISSGWDSGTWDGINYMDNK